MWHNGLYRVNSVAMLLLVGQTTSDDFVQGTCNSQITQALTSQHTAGSCFISSQVYPSMSSGIVLVKVLNTVPSHHPPLPVLSTVAQRDETPTLWLAMRKAAVYTSCNCIAVMIRGSPGSARPLAMGRMAIQRSCTCKSCVPLPDHILRAFLIWCNAHLAGIAVRQRQPHSSRLMLPRVQADQPDQSRLIHNFNFWKPCRCCAVFRKRASASSMTASSCG